MFSRSSIKASQQSGLIWLRSLIKPWNPRLNKAIYRGRARDKSSGMSWMSWINTWLHDTINRLPIKERAFHCHIAVPWAQSAYQTKTHDPVPDSSAAWEGGGGLTVSGIVSGSSVGVCCTPGDFAQRADSWERRGNTFQHTRRDPITHTNKKKVMCTNSQRAFERQQHVRGPRKHENMSHWCRWYLDEYLHNSYKVYFSAFCQIACSPFAQLLQNESSHATTESKHPPLSAQSTCLLNLVEAHSVWIALVEAVGVTEGLQRGNWGQDVTQSDSLPQQPQSDQGTCPPQHFHGSLLTAALQAHPVHLREM